MWVGPWEIHVRITHQKHLAPWELITVRFHIQLVAEHPIKKTALSSETFKSESRARQSSQDQPMEVTPEKSHPVELRQALTSVITAANNSARKHNSH
jgi:hypothetical protein